MTTQTISIKGQQWTISKEAYVDAITCRKEKPQSVLCRTSDGYKYYVVFGTLQDAITSIARRIEQGSLN